MQLPVTRRDDVVCPLPPDEGGRRRAIRARAPGRRRRRCGGLSLVEMLIALAISALLLTATMVATDACFRAYADASQQFSAQAATRMVTNRLLTLLRTSTAHGPLGPDATSNPPATLAGNTITSPYIEMIDPMNRLLRIEYRPASSELWMIRSNLDGSDRQEQPLIAGVTSAQFSCLRRRDARGLWVLERGTMDLTVVPGADGALPVEAGNVQAIRVIGSTKPRKIED